MTVFELFKRAVRYEDVVTLYASRSIIFILCAIACWFSGGPAHSQAQIDDQARWQQDMLIWTTDYEGLIDGRVGPETIKAINKFQARLGNPVTGQLTEAERRTLGEQGLANKRRVGFEQVTDREAGVSLGIPKSIVSGPRSTKWGNQWYVRNDGLSIDTLRFGAEISLRQLYERLRSINNRTIAYERFIDDNWFVIAAFEGEAAVYIRASLVSFDNQASEIRGFSIWMGEDRPTTYQALPPAMLSSFTTTLQPPRPSPPQLSRQPSVPPPPSVRVNPPPIQAIGQAAKIGECWNGLGECPHIMMTFK